MVVKLQAFPGLLAIIGLLQFAYAIYELPAGRLFHWSQWSGTVSVGLLYKLDELFSCQTGIDRGFLASRY